MVPIDLEIDLPGGLGKLDLEDLRIERLGVTCPGSQVELTLPAAAGRTTVEVHAEAAMVVLRVPDGVAATIHAAADAIEIDTARFPPHDGDYRSPGYETATNRVDIRAAVPSGAVTVTGPPAPEM
jgi:hypothetical protein